MKRLFAVLLAVSMILSMAVLSSCGGKNVKMGLGVVSTITKLDADGDSDGKVDTAYTFAAVLVDAKGKILNVKIDAIDVSVGFDSDGKIKTAENFNTKNEKGKDYGMVAYGGATKEWFEQADAFAAACKGKTLDEVKALAASDGKAGDELVKAGCTINVADFVKATEKAVKGAKDSEASAKSELSIGVVSNQSSKKDASDEGLGVAEITTNVVAVAKNGDKVAASLMECAVVNSGINEDGTVSGTKETLKYELGSDYNMASYGQDLNGDGTVKEYNEQIDVLTAAMAGKTASEIEAIAASNGYGNEDVQKAGCTINIGDLVAATLKAVK
jgi:hypothetical protein